MNDRVNGQRSVEIRDVCAVIVIIGKDLGYRFDPRYHCVTELLTAVVKNFTITLGIGVRKKT